MAQIAKTIMTYPSDWKAWWSEKSLIRKLAPATLIGCYWLLLSALGGLRQDHLNSGALILLLAYGGRHLEKLLRFLLPLLLTGIIYDSQRFFGHHIRGDIHIAEPYAFDKFFFGVSTADGVLTPNEWWQRHTNVALDIVTGIAYLIYVPQYVAVAAYFYFGWQKSRLQTPQDQHIYVSAPRLMWGFFWLNMLGYATYYLYPAAPPWYVAEYGFGPAQLDVLPSPAGCARFDAALGVTVFQEWYSRSADVFGAIPSLHIAYPLLGAYYAFKFKRLRLATVGFYFLMCFSAVYLNHHYLLDLIWGSAYALIVGIALDLVATRGLGFLGIRAWKPFQTR